MLPKVGGHLAANFSSNFFWVWIENCITIFGCRGCQRASATNFVTNA